MIPHNKPPFVLWYEGDKSILDSSFICASGNQRSKTIDQNIANFLPEILKANLVVSEAWKGVDESVLKLSKDYPRLLILSSGLSKSLLKSKATKEDLLLTEYPRFVPINKERLRNRSRLVAAFAKNLVLFSSQKNGGINNLVTNFLNLGKEVYCFPGNGDVEDGNSELIKQGANLVTGIQDMSS